LAAAIVAEAESRGIEIVEPSEFKAIPGKGVVASVQGQRIEVLKDEAASCQVLRDGTALAKITVEDQPRPDASKAIAKLREMGLQVRMLSGDRTAAAQRVGKLIGLREEEVIAEATPEFKMSVVADAGEHVAMVGDGINDAAALAKADLGIAMASGTGAAIESANMVVPSDRVSAVAEAVDLARRTLRTIRQNLFLAFVYNSIAIPVAAFGLLGPYGPLFAAAAMGLSDVSVIGNALRLRAKLRRH
jgi:Cu+-exporting ATPase